MKRVVIICVIFVIVSLFICQISIGKSETFELQLTVKNNSQNKDMEMYMLLPQEYIEYAIKNLNGNYLTYEAPKTLKENYIIGIRVKEEQVQEEIYKENGIEYVQIKLQENSKDIYKFDIIKDYGKLNMKYRIKNEDKDYIMHIDNFKIDKDKCEIEYDYDANTVKQPDSIEIRFFTVFLIVILILIVFLGYVSYLKTR